MSLLREWKCNVCGVIYVDPTKLIGVVFHSVRAGDFRLGTAKETDGAHICQPCAKTLYEELFRRETERPT